jgi:hypothetical protein
LVCPKSLSLKFEEGPIERLSMSVITRIQLTKLTNLRSWGHYQSLEIVQNKDVPCCSILLKREVEHIRDDLVEKMVLKTFVSNRTMVRLSLERIDALPTF